MFKSFEDKKFICEAHHLVSVTTTPDSCIVKWKREVCGMMKYGRKSSVKYFGNFYLNEKCNKLNLILHCFLFCFGKLFV